MTTTELKKIAGSNAAQVAAMCDLETEATELLDPKLDATAYLERLQKKELYLDAVRFLAAALPKREAVWWACICVRQHLAEPAEPKQKMALEAAEAWVYKPGEELRRAAEAAAEVATYDSPAAWAATAVFWSGGSLGPEGQPVVPPGEDLTAKAVAGAVLLTAAELEPDKMIPCYQDFLGRGRNIAAGGDGRSAS